MTGIAARGMGDGRPGKRGTPAMVVRVLIAAVCCAALAAAAGAGTAQAQAQPPQPQAWMTGATLDQAADGSNTIFEVRARNDQDPVYVRFYGQLGRGQLRVRLVDAQNQVIWQQEVKGNFDLNTETHVPKAGTYRLGVAWFGPVQAQYNLAWDAQPIRPPAVRPTALLPGLGMLLVAAGFLLYAGRRGLHWGYLALGALGWVVTVALKFAWAIPINPVLYKPVMAALPGLPGNVVFSIYVGLLTGIFEVALAWLALRYTRLGRVPWRKALAFGIGWGVIEAGLLALSPLASVVIAMLGPNMLGGVQMDQVAALNDPLHGLAPVAERFFTIWIHILSCVLMFYAIAVRRPGYFWLSFAYKSAIDAIGGYGQLVGIGGLGTIWLLEAIVAVFGIAGWWYTRRLAARYPAPVPAAARPEQPAPLPPSAAPA